KLAAKGRPQKVQVSKPLTDVYFSKVGELPLPPYIQKARGERHNVASDESWYQTVWATKPGSFAAPTASLHFKNEHLQLLKEKGVIITYVTLHVGLGTFLPVTAEDLDHHEMHPEWVEVPATTWSAIESAKSKGKKIWALGTTVCRSLESVPRGLLNRQDDGVYQGLTNLLLQPRETEAGSDFKVVNVLLTNFHQPKSTLLALVASFAGLERVKTCYKWAIERKFRLFSYGDLSVWEK
ncbi:MAG: S-adenosylmethionine:tRNA ribosyltransferase-isomerase, partial [Pseudobdellovibrionaceae bacterium]